MGSLGRELAAAVDQSVSPTTSTATSAMNKPASSTSMGTPSVTSGAMSPEPVTVKAPPAWRYPDSCPVT